MKCILILQNNQLFAIFLLAYLFFYKARSQNCQQSSSIYDKASQICVNCDSSCESCFGTQKNQCTKCKSGLFFQAQDNLCQINCENTFYQDFLSMTCRKCLVPGCAQCDINNICLECQQNLELQSNGLCYQKQNACNGQQLYDIRQTKCVQTCENNTIENQETKTCQNLSNCNIVNEYQSYQIKNGVESVMILSNKNILLYEFPCRFYITDQNLQIQQFFELMPENQFLSKLTADKVFFSQNDIVGCSGINKLIIYDVVKEQYIHEVDLSFSTNVAIKYVAYTIQTIFYTFLDGTYSVAALNLNLKNQVLILKNEVINLLSTINVKKRMIMLYSNKSNQTYIYQILSDGSFQQYVVPIKDFSQTFILNDEQGIFACFVSSQLEIYQLDQRDTLTVTLLFSISSLTRFNNECAFLISLNYIIISFMTEKFLNIYKIADDWKSNSLVSKITSSAQITIGGLAIINQSNDRAYIRIRDTLQVCFIPLNVNSFILPTQTFSNFECVVYSQLNLPPMNRIFLIEKQILIFYNFSTKALQLYTAEIGIQQLQTQTFKSTEGYTNYFEPALYFTDEVHQQNLSQQNSFFLIKQSFSYSYYSKFVFFENQLPLLYYQNNNQFRNNWVNEYFLDEQNKIVVCHAFLYILNSQNLYQVQYEDDKSQRKLLIYNISTFKVIYKIIIPQSYPKVLVETSILIKKQNYIFIKSYNILFDLNTNTLVTTYSSDISQNPYYISFAIDDKIMIIDNIFMIVKYYDLVTNKYIQIFQNYNYYYIEFIIQSCQSGDVELFNDQYLYFFIDLGQIQAFSLKTNSFISATIKINDYHHDLSNCFFQGVQNNELFLFTATKVVQFTSGLQISQTYQFPSENTKLISYYKYNDQYILSANEQAIFKFDLSTKIFTTLFTQISVHTLQIPYQLRFFGSEYELVYYGNLIVNHQQMKVVQQFDKYVSFSKIYYAKTETDSFSHLIDQKITEMMFLRNIEKYPTYSYDLGSSQSKIIYKDNIKYIIYYYNFISQKIIKQDLLNPSTKKEYSFDQQFDQMVVDTISDIFIFTDQGNNLYIFNPKVQKQQIKHLSTYESIEKLDICEYQSTIVVQANLQQIQILQYIQSKNYAVNLTKYTTDNTLKYMVSCSKNIIIVYSPELREYLIDNGEENNNSIFKSIQNNVFNCKPFYDIENKVVIYPASIDNQYILIKDKVSAKSFINCKDGVTDLNFDYNLNLVIIIEGKLRNIKIIDGFTSSVKYQATTVNYFNNKNYKIDTKTNQIIILDASPSLVIYNYLNNQLSSNALDYIKLNGFFVDIDKQYIFFYDSNFIYIHTFPRIEFKISLYDPKNPNSIINEIILDQTLNTLIVYKDAQQILLYDINQMIYTDALYQTQYFEIQSLTFDSDLYLLYNIRNRALSLFQVNTFKDSLNVIKTDITQLLFGKLIKTSQNQFIYLNLDYMLFGQVDINKSKIVKICEKFNQISIKDIYFNKDLQTLIIIENFSDNIYYLDLLQLLIQKSFNFILKVANNNLYKFFSGFIQQKYIIFYNNNIIYSLNTENSNINSKKISINQISLIVKLSPPNSEIDVINSSNSYILDYLNTNEFDLQSSSILVIINDDKMLKIINGNTLNEQFIFEVDYLILNVYVERQRHLIFVVGNRGVTHIFNYELKEMAVLTNPCLQQTKIQSDNFNIYIFCEKQLDVYNRFTLQKVYPTQIIQNSLNKIIYTQQNNVFILISNKVIQVALLSFTSQTIKVLFEKEQKLLKILNYKITSDINYSKYLNIVGLSLTDIVYYRVALEQSSICTYTYEQSDSEMSNHFNQKIIQLNMVYSNQKLKELRIQYKQDQELQSPPIYGTTSSDGLKVNIFSIKSIDSQIQITLKWVDSSIFNNRQITSLQINSLNLNIQSNSDFILNQQLNMKQLQIYEINILSLNNPFIIQNYEKVILSSINFNEFQQQFNNDLISFINCKEIFIENLVIVESQFMQGCIFKFVNSNIIIIKNIKIVDSKLKTLFSFSQIQQVIIDGLYLMNLSVQSNIVDQINTISTILSNISLNTLIGGLFLKQLGCQKLSIDKFNIINSQSLLIVEVIEYINTVVYQNLLTQIVNMTIQNSDDISFHLISDKIELTDSTIDNIILGQKHLFTLISKQLNLNNVNFNEIKSQHNVFIVSVRNFDDVLLKNTKFIQNSIQLIVLINQSEGKIIKFDQVQIIENSCQESLVQLQLTQSLEIIASQFTKNSGKINGGVIQIQSMNTLKISNSKFEENISIQGKGGALYLYDVIQASIENTSFNNNESVSDNGGSIYYFSSDIIQTCSKFLINKNSIFKDNKALAGKGGAIFLSKVNLLLENVKINKNLAAIGGGIFYENVIPDIILDDKQKKLYEISNNKAIFFGQNFGSTLRKIKFIPNNQEENSYYFSTLPIPNLFEIQNFQSGSYIQLSDINLIDEEENLIDLKQMNNVSLNSIVQKELESISLSITNINLQQQIIFQGGVVQKYQQKGFNFNISLNYQPSSQCSFQLSSNIISGLKYSNGSDYIKESQINLEFQVNFRECLVGEIRIGVLDNTICEKCPDGKYSLNENDIVCKQCPIFADSCHGSKIVVKQGYWRKNEQTDIIISCSKYLNSCQPQNPESKFGCSEGFVGPLCEQCDYEGAVWDDRYSYSFSAKQFCSKCSNNVFFFVINIILFFLIQFIQIIFAINGITAQVERYLSIYYMKLIGFLYLNNSGIFFLTEIEKKKNLSKSKKIYQKIQIILIFKIHLIDTPPSINNQIKTHQKNKIKNVLQFIYHYFLNFMYYKSIEKNTQNPVFQKILIDHLQIISIANSFNLQLPSFFNYGSEVIGNPLQISSIAFDCFYSLKINKTIPYWFFKFIWSVLFPFMLIISYLLFNKIKAVFKFSYNSSRYNTTAIIYIYLFYFPSMITLISKSINCRRIGDESYSQIDLTMSCREYEEHGKYIYIFILPFAIVFAIILPSILYLKIKNERQNKVSRITQSRYKFLYEAFEERFYFWEILRLGFKSFIMITSILLFEFLNIKVNYSNLSYKILMKFHKIQACTISISLMAYYSLQMKFKPYRLSQINYLESQSTLICILTINLCLLYQEITQLNQILGQLTSLLIYLTNIYFIVKLLLFIFLKPIPAEYQKRNFFQNLLFKIKQRFPQSLPFISVQLKVSMKALLKIKVIKMDKMKNENNKFKKNLVRLIKNSTIRESQAPLLHKLMIGNENQELVKPALLINSEIQPTEIGQLMLLQNRYLTRTPTSNKKKSEFLLRTEEYEKSISTLQSPYVLESSQVRTNSIFQWNQQTLITDEQGDHIVEKNNQ